MVIQSYAENFWGGDLSSTHGYDNLIKRNQDGKKMCQELEDYLKKRAKLEFEFSKSLSNLMKCFKIREPVGQLETALNHFRQELQSISISHHGAGAFFTNQADAVKGFREEQSIAVKEIEESLLKTQNAKLNQWSQLLRLEKTYLKKCADKDFAEINVKKAERENVQVKDVEKAKSKLTKTEEDAQKADNGYRSGIVVLESTCADWEKMMDKACKIIQELDEKRVGYLRQELWVSVNVDSKLSLDIDNVCESVRQKLEKCDVMKDIQAFIKSAGTGKVRPKRYSFKHYTGGKDIDSDADSTTSSTEVNDDERSGDKTFGTLSRKKIFSKMKPMKL